MKDVRKSLLPLLGASLLAATTISCASLNQRLVIAPLTGPLPVSASSTLLVDGKVVPEPSIRVIKQFRFTKEFTSPMTQEEARLDLGADLREIAEEAGAKAITGLKIVAKGIDSPVEWLAFERWAGGGLTILGIAGTVALVVLPLVYSHYEDTGGGKLISVLGVTGAGALTLGGSCLHESLGTVRYVLEVEGTAVTY